jgi:hypothetical protein
MSEPIAEPGPIVPPNHSLTAAAREALEAQGIPVPEGDTDSDGEFDGEFFENLTPEDFRSTMGPTADEVVDAIIVDSPPDDKPAARSRSRSRAPKDESEPRDPKAGPPSLDEWSKFFSRVVLRVATQWYLNYAFRGIDEDTLSEREIERLALTDEERKTIAVPFAELSNKSKFMRKHGRTLVASGDAFNSMVVMGAWMSRVNKIAAKHRPPKVRINNEYRRPGPESGEQASGATGGRVPNGYPIFPGTG